MTFLTSHCFSIVPDDGGGKALRNVGIRVADYTAAVLSVTVVQHDMLSCHSSWCNLVQLLWRHSFKTPSVDSLSFNIFIGVQQAAPWPCDKRRRRFSTQKFCIGL